MPTHTDTPVCSPTSSLYQYQKGAWPKWLGIMFYRVIFVPSTRCIIHYDLYIIGLMTVDIGLNDSNVNGRAI